MHSYLLTYHSYLIDVPWRLVSPFWILAYLAFIFISGRIVVSAATIKIGRCTLGYCNIPFHLLLLSGYYLVFSLLWFIDHTIGLFNIPFNLLAIHVP